MPPGFGRMGVVAPGTEGLPRPARKTSPWIRTGRTDPARPPPKRETAGLTVRRPLPRRQKGEAFRGDKGPGGCGAGRSRFIRGKLQERMAGLGP